MKIKEVSPIDLDEIFTLEQKIFKENAFSKDLIKKLIQKNTLFLKLEKSEKKKKLIGFTIVVKDRKDRANIINFLINPKYQNKGYGSFLLQKIIDAIKELNEIKKVILNVNVDNSVAIKLYEKFNFRIIKKVENYYRSKEGAYLMELNANKTRPRRVKKTRRRES